MTFFNFILILVFVYVFVLQQKIVFLLKDLCIVHLTRDHIVPGCVISLRVPQFTSQWIYP